MWKEKDKPAADSLMGGWQLVKTPSAFRLPGIEIVGQKVSLRQWL
jgi:hypothetical protein